MFKTLLIIALLSALGWFGWQSFSDTPPQDAMHGGSMPVMVAGVMQKNITIWDEFSGRLTAVDHVQLRPRVAGMVESIHFKDGQMVQKGDLLFVIDPRPYKAALNAAEAAFDLAKTEFDRAEPLLAEQAISQRNFDQRKSALASAKSQLTQARLNLEYTQVEAPISGKVGRREITPGNLVDIGMPVLTTIVSQNPIYADFEADEQRFISYLATTGNDAGKLSNIPVTLELANQNNITHTGYVHSFDNQIDTGSGTIRVRAVFENKDGTLVPGMFVRLFMGAAGSEQAILIAEKAINTDQNKKYVYVVGDDNTAAYRQVQLGPVYEGMRVIRDGLKPGERIIVSSTRLLRPGMPVAPNDVPMEDAGKQVPEVGGQGSEKKEDAAPDTTTDSEKQDEKP